MVALHGHWAPANNAPSDWFKQLHVCVTHGGIHQIDVLGKDGIHLTDCPSHATFNLKYATEFNALFGGKHVAISGSPYMAGTGRGPITE